MYRDAPLDDRYRRAHAAAREVAQLARMIGELDREIGRQRGNAMRMRELLAGEHNAETIEVLAASVHEATAASEELSQQRAVMVQRRDELAPFADQLAELRAERVASLAETPAGDEALALITRLAELDDEQRAIAHAIVAGEAAEDPLIAITAVDAVSTGHDQNRAHDYSVELAALVRNLRRHAGPATARLVVFRRALADIGLELIAELPSTEQRTLFFTSAGASPYHDDVWGRLSPWCSRSLPGSPSCAGARRPWTRPSPSSRPSATPCSKRRHDRAVPCAAMGLPTIASGALRKLVTYAGTIGIDRATLLTELGVAADVLDGRDARVPLAHVHAVWASLVARVPAAEAQFAGEPYAPADYGLVGFVVMTSATIDEALDHFIRYVGLWTDEPRFSRDGATVRLVYRHAFPDSVGCGWRPSRRSSRSSTPRAR